MPRSRHVALITAVLVICSACGWSESAEPVAVESVPTAIAAPPTAETLPPPTSLPTTPPVADAPPPGPTPITLSGGRGIRVPTPDPAEPTATASPTPDPVTAEPTPSPTAPATVEPTVTESPTVTTPTENSEGAEGLVAVANGAEVYTLNCARCHGENGMGSFQASGLIGVGSRWGADSLISELTSGHPYTFGFGDELSAREIADVVAYVQATFG